MLKTPHLFEQGFHLSSFSLDSDIKSLVAAQDWVTLDQRFKTLTMPQGELYQFLSQYHEFSTIEFIISIRDAANEWEEDGIWHDDGSRVFAFSLSLTLDSIEGGKLGVRRQGQESMQLIPTPNYGGIILFLTGIYGYEHRIHQVTQGQRIIIAGWCS